MINEVNLAPYFLFNLLEIMRNYLKRLGPFLSQKTIYDSDGNEISQGDSDQINRSRSAESWRG